MTGNYRARSAISVHGEAATSCAYFAMPDCEAPGARAFVPLATVADTNHDMVIELYSPSKNRYLAEPSANEASHLTCFAHLLLRSMQTTRPSVCARWAAIGADISALIASAALLQSSSDGKRSIAWLVEFVGLPKTIHCKEIKRTHSMLWSLFVKSHHF
jgi:hypothetical protein